MRAVLALLWWQGATCRVTQRDGRVPPSKTIKKVDCGSWNHPDSEENTRKTVYGKIGWACMAEYGEKGEIGEDQTLIDVGIGTGLTTTDPYGTTSTKLDTQTRTCAGTSTSTKPTWDGTSSLHTWCHMGLSVCGLK